MTADRVVLLAVIMDAINDVVPKITNTLVGKYAITRYLLLYIVRAIMESDNMFNDVSSNPEKFVRVCNDRDHFKKCVLTILDDIVIDLNSELDQEGEVFYYRDGLRDEKWVNDMTRRIVADHSKLVARRRISSFADEWKTRGASAVAAQNESDAER